MTFISIIVKIFLCHYRGIKGKLHINIIIVTENWGVSMYIYIEIEDLVANALIELVEHKGKREVLFKELDEYGARVVEVLSSDGQTKAALLVSRESQMAVLEDYTDMFEPYEWNGAKGIRLKDGVQTIDLWKRFCTSLSLKVINAFQSARTKEALGV